MKHATLVLLAFAALFPVRGMSQPLDASRLTGQWSGPATFFNAELARRTGTLPFTVNFSADGAGTGRLGESAFKVVRVQRTRAGIDVRATLAGSVAPDPALAKDHLVLVVTVLTDSAMQAEFHLKSNFTYDPRMREGRVVLTRLRASP